MTNFPKSPVPRADERLVSGRGRAGSEGFGLTESLMAILILALGFMYLGPMMAGSINSTTLARSKGTAKLAATNHLEWLALKYEADRNDADLTVGDHGPTQVQIVNPVDDSIINRYNVSWTVTQMTDATGMTLKAVQVTATVTPIQSTGVEENIQVRQNKVVNVSTILSPKL